MTWREVELVSGTLCRCCSDFVRELGSKEGCGWVESPPAVVLGYVATGYHQRE